MDVASVIRYRLAELGVEQRDLAVGAGVTESYISQLLAKKKTPPAPARTDIYSKIAKVLKLPPGELARLAETERQEELKRKVLDPPRPLFQEFRRLILKKCVAAKRQQIGDIFEREPFGAFERFVTERLFDAAKQVAGKELENPKWIDRVAQISKRSAAETRLRMTEFLGADVFHVAVENFVLCFDPLLQSWDIEMGSFRMDIELNRRLTERYSKSFEFREVEREPPTVMQPGLEDFLEDVELSAGITQEEVDFLKRLRMDGMRPSVLYYYRELQNLRDPLSVAPLSIEKSPKALAVKRVQKSRGRKAT